METIKLEVGETPTVKVEVIGGDHRLSGRQDTQFEAQAPERGTLTVDHDGDQIQVSCRSGCLIFLPAAAKVEVEQVGGDARVIGLTSDLMMKTVGGDLSLRRVARATFELIGGDLHARIRHCHQIVPSHVHLSENGRAPNLKTRQYGFGGNNL